MKSMKNRREKLWRVNPHCYFCGVLTVRPPSGRSRKITPHNQATVDHLRSRFHPDRQEPNPEWNERTVLACWKCNYERGRADEAAQPLEELHRRCNPNRVEHPKADEIRRAWKETGLKFSDLRKRKGVRKATASFMKDRITFEQFVEAIKIAAQFTG